MYYSGAPTTSNVVTFITTDKNPAVIFTVSEPPPPHWIISDVAKSHAAQNTKTSADNGARPGPPIKTVTKLLPLQPPSPAPTYVVSARGDQVIINHDTFTDLKPGQTRTVTAAGEVFTIFPDIVIGNGISIAKPEPASSHIVIPAPTTTTLAGVGVTMSGSRAIIDGTAFAIPPTSISVVADDQVVSLAPGIVVIDGQTLTYQTTAVAPTSILVGGGEMLTAAGASVIVIESTTITYGTGIPETSIVVDDDTVSIGPSGAVISDATLGGSNMGATDSAFTIVGGATITEVGSSLVILAGKTYTVGPGAPLFTATVNGEIITLGPDGIEVSTLTFTYPFGATVITTVLPSGTTWADGPIETEEAREGDADDENEAVIVAGPRLVRLLTAYALIFGVLVWL